MAGKRSRALKFITNRRFVNVIENPIGIYRHAEGGLNFLILVYVSVKVLL